MVEKGKALTTANYDPVVALRVVERIAEGETLIAILKPEDGMPSREVFRKWMVNNPDLARAFLAAREISASAFEEQAIEAARAIKANPIDGTHVRATEVYINQMRWSAERRNPQQYGNRQEIKVKVPIQINTTLDLGQGALSASTKEFPDIYSLSATMVKDEKEVPVGEQPLVEEKRYSRGGKRILTPPSKNPFTLANARKNVSPVQDAKPNGEGD